MISFLTQICDIINTISDEITLDQLGRISTEDNVVAGNLACRIDPVRFRSRQDMTDERPGFARALEFHSMIYTEWTESDITNDMRVRVRKYYGMPDPDPDNDDNNYEYYNIVSVNRVTTGIEGHHLEIEVYSGRNV